MRVSSNGRSSVHVVGSWKVLLVGSWKVLLVGVPDQPAAPAIPRHH